MHRARWIKTEREIGLLRRAAHLADVGHTTLTGCATRPGRNEIAMWCRVRTIFMEAGRDIIAQWRADYRTAIRDRCSIPMDLATGTPRRAMPR